MTKCILCQNENFTTIHKGTRDNANLDVLKCNSCGLVFLSSFEHIDESYYEDSHMHDNEAESNFSEWREMTHDEDNARFERLFELCKGKAVLDFGCGNGGFLDALRKSGIAEKLIGIEVEEEARNTLNKVGGGISVYESIDDCRDKVDVITCFHVIEHLQEPEKYLSMMKEHLTENGIIILETPNADDILLSLYKVKEFEDFTYWSPHIMLYNNNTIALLAKKAGLTVKWNKQLQRYPLSNHLYWLANGQPGGHEKWQLFNKKELINAYEKVLAENHMCDTLFVGLCK